MVKKIAEDANEKWETYKTNVTKAYDMISNANANINNFMSSISDSITQYFTTLVGGTKEGYYKVGQLVFEVAVLVLTGGAGAALKATANVAKSVSAKVVNKMDDIGSFFSNVGQATSRGGVAAKKWFKCRILGNGCFVKDTPVLMAGNNPFTASALGYSMALLPIVSPIQDIKPDDVVKAYHHEQVFYATADNNKNVYVPGWQSYD